MNPSPLTSPRIPRFIEEYAAGLSGTQAALNAGWPPSWASQAASEILANPKMQERVQAQREKLARGVNLQAMDVLKEWVAIAAADASKLMWVQKNNCRHCWGANHEYQWSAREYAEACDAALRLANPLPDCMGGFGWLPKRDPNPGCTQCTGAGTEEIIYADTRTLTDAERKLYAGVKRTRGGGIEIIRRDQEAALNNLAKYLGMLVDKKEVTGANGGPLGVVGLKADDLTDDQLAALLVASGATD